MSKLILQIMVGLLILGYLVSAIDSQAADETSGYLGLRLLADRCRLYQGHDAHTYVFFKSPPEVEDVDPDGPAAGKLRAGDVVISINGLGIATRTASKLIQYPAVGDKLEIEIQRNGHPQTVIITAIADTGSDWATSTRFTANHAVVETSGASSRTSISTRSRANSRSSFRSRSTDSTASSTSDYRGSKPPYNAWFGLSISMDGFTWTKEGDPYRHYSFESAPEIYIVDTDSPAYRAGLRRQDILTHIDGVALDSDEGSDLFSAIKVGQDVVFTYDRNGKSKDARLTAEENPNSQPTIEIDSGRSHEQRLRFADTLGDVDVEVRGIGDVQVTVTEGKGQRAITINLDGYTVTLDQNK